MHNTVSLRLFAVFSAAAILAAGCSASSHTPGQGVIQSFPASHSSRDALQTPALLAVEFGTGTLEFWPMQRNGGGSPQVLSSSLGIGSSGGMVANGHVVAIANEGTPEVVEYDVATKRLRTLPDPFGIPIDLAIDKNDALYAMNAGSPGNVAYYPAGARNPVKLACHAIYLGEAIAVDNEGDIFVNGYPRNGPAGVVEIPNGPSGPDPGNCMKLALRSEPGYVSGIAVDPKTDDLIVLDDPDFCAGGIEGRMTIYPKPYQPTNAVVRYLNANCAGLIRLSAYSDRVFVLDEDVSGSFTFVLQRSYPDGRDLGEYDNGDPAGFTTIPNALPN